jgi:hypothetical protein
MALKRGQILAADDRRYEIVKVPEWATDGDDEVRIRSLSGKERDAFEASMVDVNRKGEQKRNVENLRARLVALSIVDEDGEVQFSNPDIKQLGDKSAKALDRVADAAQKLSGLSPADVEELAGNSDSDQNESSTSDSL